MCFYYRTFFYLFFFFFQAEDGIRDLYVTGVHTCALPIFGHGAVDENGRWSMNREADVSAGRQRGRSGELLRRGLLKKVRSEEHTSELQSRRDLVCRLLLEKKNN